MRLLPAVLSILLFYGGLRFLRSARTAVYLAWCILGAILIPVTLLLWWGDPLDLLFTRTVSGLATGGFSVATKIENIGSTLQQWPALMPELKGESIHVALGLPGWPLVYYGLAKLLAAFPQLSQPLGMGLRLFLCHNIPIMNLSNAQLASSWLGIAAPIWAALTIIPLYYLARSVANEAVARNAVAWWPIVPSVAMFLGSLNTPTPLIFMIILYLLWTGLTGDKHGHVNWRLILAGCLTAVALLFTFAFIPLLLFAGLLALVTWQRDIEKSFILDLAHPLWSGVQFGLGLLLPLALYTLLAGHTPLIVLQNSMQIHLDLQRRYWPWLWLHSWDFIIFVGLPAFCLFVLGLTRWGAPRVRQLATALVLTLLIVVVSGTARGETGRLWLFFMPIVLVAAAAVLVKLPFRLRFGLLVSQIIWLLALFAIMPTIGTGLTPPPAYEQVAFPPGDHQVTAATADFAGLLRLDGYSASFDESDNALIVDLHWASQEQIADPYFFSALLVSPAGDILPARDWQPFDYQFPTTCWHDVGGPLVDRISLPLAENDQVGDYWMSLAVFKLSPGGQVLRLPVTLPDGSVDNQVGIGPLRVED